VCLSCLTVSDCQCHSAAAAAYDDGDHDDMVANVALTV